MKYAVMGTGGTGGCIGGYLAAAGRDVDLIARGEHLKAIKQNGLTVESSDRGIIHIPGTRAFSAEEYGKKADVIFVCVKYYSLGEAVEFVKRASHSGTAVHIHLCLYKGIRCYSKAVRYIQGGVRHRGKGR